MHDRNCDIYSLLILIMIIIINDMYENLSLSELNKNFTLFIRDNEKKIMERIFNQERKHCCCALKNANKLNWW